MIHPAVIELERSIGQTLDAHPTERIVGTRGKAFAFGIRQSDDIVGNNRAINVLADEITDVGKWLAFRMIVACMFHVGLGQEQRTIRLLRIDAALVVHYPWLAKEYAWEEFHVEASLAYEIIRDWAVKIDRHENVTALSFNLDIICQLQIGIYHRVEACEMARRVGETESSDNALSYLLAVELSRHGLPLTRSGFKTDVTIASYATSVHQQAHSSLMTLGIEIVECHNIYTLAVEITLLIEHKILGGCL